MNRNAQVDLQLLEHEARRLRAQYVGDRLAQLVLAVDVRVRRVAHRIAAGLGGW